MGRILTGAALAALVALCAGGLLSSCGTSALPPGPAGDGGPDLDAGGCYTNPRTSFEIINACTDAGYIDKRPTLPLLLPDGGLPPLP